MTSEPLLNIVDHDGKTIVLVPDLRRLVDAIGLDGFVAFSRAFVWCDRLLTLTGLGASLSGGPARSSAVLRDEQSLFWFICGCVRELALAAGQLRQSGIQDLLRPERHALLGDLDALLARWAENSEFTKLRNRAGFHVDEDIIARGLKALLLNGRPQIFLDADGDSVGARRFLLAHELLVTGVFTGPRLNVAPDAVDAERVDRIILSVADDQRELAALLEELFRACVEGWQSGLRRAETQPLASPSRFAEVHERARQALRSVGKDLPGWDEASPLDAKAARVADEVRRLRADRRELRRENAMLRKAAAPSPET